MELLFSPRLWGIPSVSWHPDLLNSSKPQALVFPCRLNKILPFRKQTPVDSSPCQRGRFQGYMGQLRSQLPHFEGIRCESDASHCWYLSKPFSLFSLTPFKTFVSVLEWLHGGPTGLVVRVVGSCQKLQKGWGPHHHELTSGLCKLYLIADY